MNQQNGSGINAVWCLGGLEIRRMVPPSERWAAVRSLLAQAWAKQRGPAIGSSSEGSRQDEGLDGGRWLAEAKEGGNTASSLIRQAAEMVHAAVSAPLVSLHSAFVMAQIQAGMFF